MKREIVAISIPTGIGAEIGGFAGDGGKIARLFSKHFDVLVHPNVVNGGILSGINRHMFYLEGFLFDEFFKGALNFCPLGEFEQNKVGVVFDKAIPKDILNIHINTINAMREVKGLDIPYFEITKEEAGVEFFTKNGVSTGGLKNEKTVLESAKKLVEKGCNAIGIVCYFEDDITNEDYENGTGVDPIGGVEAVISHYLAQKLKIPTAHAPAFSSVDISTELSNPKVASENISSTYLPCILEGLSVAPKIVKPDLKGIKNKDIKALIVPYKALGNIAVLSAIESGIKVCAIKNETNTDIGCEQLKTGAIMEYISYEACLESLLKDRI